MKRLPSWLIGSAAKLRQPETPAAQENRLSLRMNAVQRSSGRRLSDRIEIIFEEACVAGDLETAELLLDALEQRYRMYTSGRRASDALISQLREKLTTRKAAFGRR